MKSTNHSVLGEKVIIGRAGSGPTSELLTLEGATNHVQAPTLARGLREYDESKIANWISDTSNIISRQICERSYAYKFAIRIPNWDLRGAQTEPLQQSKRGSYCALSQTTRASSNWWFKLFLTMPTNSHYISQLQISLFRSGKPGESTWYDIRSCIFEESQSRSLASVSTLANVNIVLFCRAFQVLKIIGWTSCRCVIEKTNVHTVNHVTFAFADKAALRIDVPSAGVNTRRRPMRSFFFCQIYDQVFAVLERLKYAIVYPFICHSAKVFLSFRLHCLQYRICATVFWLLSAVSSISAT